MLDSRRRALMALFWIFTPRGKSQSIAKSFHQHLNQAEHSTNDRDSLQSNRQNCIRRTIWCILPPESGDPSSAPMNEDIIIWTEGKTDAQYLTRARDVLKYPQTIKFELLDEMGDDKLIKQCQALSRVPQSTPTIFIFD